MNMYIGGVRVTHCWSCRRYIPVADEPHDCTPADGRPLVTFLNARLEERPTSVEVAAIRQVVDLHFNPGHPRDCLVCAEAVGHLDDEHDEAPCDTLRALAAAYADHPDYDEAWRP